VTSTHEPGDHFNRRGAYTTEPVTIGAGCWIGSRALILPGVNIADGCTIGAGSVVTRDCEADGFYAGVPARRVKDLP
jgi:acetyltransferase-like isoleucine patch superfamily enzyme